VRKAKGHRSAVGRARYDVAPGRSQTLRVKLAKGSARLADRHGHLRVIAVASTASAGKVARSSRHLTLVLHTPAKRK
jgi:hypothetical protein